MSIRRLISGAIMVTAVLTVIAANAQKPALLMSGMPSPFGLDPDKGLFFALGENILYACDITSGTEIWSRTLESAGGRKDVWQTKDTVVLMDTKRHRAEILGLDTATGIVKWKDVPRTRDTFEGILGWPTSSWYFQAYDLSRGNISSPRGYFIVCSPSTGQWYKLPLNTRPLRWIEEGKTLLLLSLEDRLLRWDLGANRAQECGIMGEFRSYSLLAEWRALLMRSKDGSDTEYGYQIVDLKTGQFIRDVYPPQSLERLPWIQPLHDNSTQLLVFDRENHALRLMDAYTDERLLSLEAPGHQFLPGTVREDASGITWILSLDEAQHLYLWSLQDKVDSRKVLHSTDWITGLIVRIQPPYVLTSAFLQKEKSIWYTYEPFAKPHFLT